MTEIKPDTSRFPLARDTKAYSDQRDAISTGNYTPVSGGEENTKQVEEMAGELKKMIKNHLEQIKNGSSSLPPKKEQKDSTGNHA